MLRRVIIFFILVCSNLFSRTSNNDVTKDFYSRITKSYLQSDVLSYTYKVVQYDTSGKNVLKTMSGRVYQSKYLFSYDLENVKVVYQDSFYLTVNMDKKEMIYHVVSKELIHQNQNFDVAKFIEQLKTMNMKVVAKKSCEENMECYNLVHGTLDENLYQIKTDKHTGYISFVRIDYYGSTDKQNIEPYIMEIFYSDYRNIPLNEYRPLDEFVLIKNGALEVNDKFKGFQIIRY